MRRLVCRAKAFHWIKLRNRSSNKHSRKPAAIKPKPRIYWVSHVTNSVTGSKNFVGLRRLQLRLNKGRWRTIERRSGLFAPRRVGDFPQAPSFAARDFTYS